MHADDNDKNMEFEYKKVDKRVDHAGADVEEPSAAEDSAASDEPAPADAGVSEQQPAEVDEPVIEDSDTVEQPEDEAGPEPSADAGAEPLEPGALSVYQVLRIFVGMLSDQAWINLGLRMAPGATETEVKLTEARISIDTLRFVRGQLDADLQDAEKRELDNLISSLQLNFVQKS